METTELSIVAAAHCEADNIEGLVGDVKRAMSDTGIAFELLIIDDGSTDETANMIAAQMARYSWVRGWCMPKTIHGRGNGQSAAFFCGIRESRGELVALLDADRQNDPADLLTMMTPLRRGEADLVQGDRSLNRQDSMMRRISCWVGRIFRRLFLGDSIRDTGCSLRIFRREVGLDLPLRYCGLHRFIPFCARMLGYRVVEVPVSHRPRTSGVSKYGVWNRALPGLRDLLAVRWMRSRVRLVAVDPIVAREPD